MATMFSQRHFNKIAATIKERREKIKGYDCSEKAKENALAGLNNLVLDFTRVFSEDNPRFKTDKFIEACGIYSN